MSLFSLLLLSIGLSIDSLAASITAGACTGRINLKHVLKIAFYMAVFQGTMPLIGWIIGASFKVYIEAFDHWIAFFLLLLIGAKLIKDGLDKTQKPNTKYFAHNNFILIGMALATSIDALIVGIGFGLIEIQMGLAVIIIGLTTFVFSFSGVYIGKKIGSKINRGIEIFGGLILISIGIKILLSHLY